MLDRDIPSANDDLKTWKSAYASLSAEFIETRQELSRAYQELALANQELTQVKQELLQAKQEINSLLLQRQASDIKITTLEAEITSLKELFKSVQHQLFGKKSEKDIGEPITTEQMLPLVTVKGHTRKQGTKSQGRRIDTSTLLRYKIYHDLPEEQKTCQQCNNLLEQIGFETSEQLEVLPLLLYVAEHIRYKYTCRTCQILKMAPKPKAPIPKALAGASLLTEVVVNKYEYHLPLYRQSKILKSYNAIIPDNTLGNWVMEAGAGLMPKLSEAMWRVMLAVNYLQVDESPVKILKPEKKGYLWVYFAPHVGKGLIIFELSLTRGSVDNVEKRLANFKGLVQTDGYPGYDKLRKREDITGLGCLSHARRKFDAVLKITKNAVGVASEFIKRVKPLYALEAKMRDLNVSFHTRKRLRQKYAWPILKELHSWLKQQKIPPNSKLADAVTYTLNQWRYIVAYTRHGEAEIDTNWIENQIRPIAVGKRNWLFMGHKDSGAIHAFWYSLVLSAVMNGLNPRTYIHYLLMHTHELRKGTIDPMTLLPHTIDRKKLQTFADEQLVLAKEVLDSS